MDRLPSELLRGIAQSLVDEVVNCALPALGAQRHSYDVLPLARQASDALASLSGCSRGWRSVALPVWASFLALDGDAFVRRQRRIALLRDVRVLAFELGHDRQHASQLVETVARCVGVEVILATSPAALQYALAPSHTSCHAVYLGDGGGRVSLWDLQDRLPALRELRLQRAAAVRGLFDPSSKLHRLGVLTAIEAHHLVGSCSQLVELELCLGGPVALRMAASSFPPNLRHVALHGWTGEDVTTVGALAHDLGVATAQLSTLDFIDAPAHRDTALDMATRAPSVRCAVEPLAEALRMLAATSPACRVRAFRHIEESVGSSPSDSAAVCAAAFDDVLRSLGGGLFEARRRR